MKNTYTVHKSGHSGSTGYGLGRGATATYAGSSVWVTDSSGNVVARYSRQATGWGPAEMVAEYTLTESHGKFPTGKVLSLYPRKGPVVLGHCDGTPAPGKYRNLREAWKAQVEALYGIQIGR